MEFLRTCSTNAQSIGGYEVVSYRAFSAKPTTAPASARVNDLSPAEHLGAVEAELRQRGLFVVRDATRPWLWLFRPTTLGNPGGERQEPPLLDGYEYQHQQNGVIKASDLALPATKATNPTAPSPATPSSSSNSFVFAGRAPQVGVGLQPQPRDFLLLYELFVSSIVALISYRLVQHHNAVALNFRTFLSKAHLVPEQAAEDDALPFRSPYRMTSLSVSWASTGTLLVSTFPTVEPGIRCLADASTIDEQKDLVGSCLRIAPNGLLAKLVGLEDPLDPVSEDSKNPLKKRVKLAPVEHVIEKWKSAVTRWLSWKGYSMAGLQANTSWARIRLAQPSQLTTSASFSSNQSRDILWPRALCFYYRPAQAPTSSSVGILDGADDPLEWFATPQSLGFRDPIDSAEQWFSGKPERDKALEAKRRARKVEEEATRRKEETSGGLFPSSPLNSRTHVYSDLQAASGVYPTPPDGVLPGTVPTNSDTPGGPGPTANTVLVPGKNNPAINVSAPQDNSLPEEQGHVAMSSTFPTSYDNFNSEGPNDDLFDDMDEDGFGGDGVTDADFNFFDEPGEGDIDMHDAPEAEREPAPKIKDEKEDDVPEISEDDLMQEAHDPMAALADALVSVASTSIEEKWSKMMTNASTDRLSDTDSRAPQPGLLRGSSGVAVKKEPATDAFTMLAKSALSRQTSALSTPITENQHAAHRNSIFAPITFGQEVSLSDAKYHSGRFAVRHEPVATAAENVKTSMKQSRSLRDLPLNVTKLRYALGVSANSAGRQPPSLADSDDETSDSASDKSFISDDEGEDVASLVPGPLSVASINTMKRKLPTDGSATPLSATSFAESFGGDRPDHVSVQTDILHLTLFEPTRWDWPLTDLPPPTEIQSVVTRSGVPAFSPLATSMPGTPTSQADQSLTDPEDKPLSRNDSIAVAQVVTDQIISATLDILHEDSSPRLKRSPDSTSAELQIALKDVFPKVTQCNLAALASIADVYPDLPPQVKAQQRPPPRKPNEGASLPGSHILPIQPPFVRMRRSDTLWEFLPPALGFWDSLGLGPCSSAKNVGAVCIYPHSDSLKPCLQHFLLNLRIMYEGCRLGNHELVDLDSDSAGSAVDGLVPWTLSHPSSTRAAFRSLRDTCTMLGRALSAKYAQEGDSDDAAQTNAVVIYMVNPFRDPTAVWELCSAFWSLFQAYGQGSSAWMDHGSKPDVVLQIVPIEYVASFDVPVILSASTYATLAREVYDRCPPSAPSEDRCPLSIYAAPSFQLEESIPRRIDFRLQADAPQDLLRENSYIHIGYSISLDGNWVTAAWTDTCGKSCTSVSYNLGTRAFIEVANEIWQTTVEMCQVRKVTWRVCIARCGVMEREEHEAWHYFSTLHTPVNLFIMVLTVDPNPPLKFTPTVPPSTGQTGNPQPAASTPASTPKAGISPDPQNLTPAATPAAEPASDASGDTEARLVDVTDETWGIILAHRVHNTNSTVEFRPSLISGLLVKRGLSHETSSTPIPPTPDPECGPIAVGVNILWVSAMTPSRAATSPFPAAGDGVSPGGAQSPGPSTERDRMSLMWTPTPQHRATAENLLKEILTQYRGLGTLARLKGIRGSRMGTVPWHIAVAKRGVEGMVKCFPASAS